MEGKCIIIGAGDLTIGEIPSLNKEDLVIAVDGGLSYCGILQVEPDIILGDFDSVSDGERQALEQLRSEIPERIITLPTEKDDTDMLAAIKYGLEKGFLEFRIYAGCGGRLDHTLANIQCLLYLKNHGATGYLVDGTGMILVIQNETVHFRETMEGILSLFALGEKAEGVTIQGMKYPLQDYTLSNDYPIGISNEFIKEAASVCVAEGATVCILQYG